MTPDSFSDGGKHFDSVAAIRHGLAMIEAGADILDIGGESTRPGSDPVTAEEQIRRVLPVIRGLAAETPALLSIDTTSAAVAEAALAAGAHIVNDISGFRFDGRMLALLAESGVPAIAMHTSGPPKTMQKQVGYGDVVTEVRDHLLGRVRAAEAAGIDPANIVLDPGLGFGKLLEHNLALLRRLPELVATGHAVLVGTSRKSFLGKITGREVGDRLFATAGSVAMAVAYGAHIVRVHDVAAMVDVVRVAEAIVRE